MGIVLSPIDFIDDNRRKQVNDFYSVMLADMGITQGKARVMVTPCSYNGDFSVAQGAAGTSEQLFDVGNKGKGNLVYATIAADPKRSRVVYDGTLESVVYAQVVTGAADLSYNAYLALGPNNALDSFIFTKRFNVVAAAFDDKWVNAMDVAAPPVFRAGFRHSFPDIMFSYLHLRSVQAGIGTSTVWWDYVFKGVRIEYQGV